MTPFDDGSHEPPSPFHGRVGITYSRVSTKGQRADAQDARCSAFLAAAGVPLDRAFSDSFTGGGDFMQRPAMRELLAYIDASPYKSFVVVFDDLKRFARDTEFHLKLRHAFQRRDVLLRCLNYSFDDTPEGRFAETVFAAQSELERHQNRRQVIQKMKARLERGYWPFARKRGYDYVKDPEHGKLCVPNADGALLAEALNGFALGRFMRPIDACRYLVERGFWKPRAPEKYLDVLASFMRDPFYCGDIEHRPWGVERRPGRHKALISHETFSLIQSRLAGREGRVRRDHSGDFPLRGLLVCTSCEGRLTAAHAKGRRKHYPYYYCPRRTCPNYAKMSPKAQVEKDFSELLGRQKLRDNVASLHALTFERAWRAETADLANAATQRTNRITELEQEISAFARLARETTIPSVRGSYEREIEKAGAALKALEETPAAPDLAVPFQTAFEKAAIMLKNPKETWDTCGPAEQHRLFFSFFEAKLPYGSQDRFQTANELSSTRLFEDFAALASTTVEVADISSNHPHSASIEELAATRFQALKSYLARFWAYHQSSPQLQDALTGLSVRS